jgi:hypothetical protein
MEATPSAEGAGEVMAVVAPSSGVVALEKEMIDAGGDAALIHTLPEEMLMMVFAWLDTETLLRAVHAVCRSWRMAMSGMYVVPYKPTHLDVHSLQPLHCILTRSLAHLSSSRRASPP